MKKNVFIISILASLLPSAAMWANDGDTFTVDGITYQISSESERTCKVGPGTNTSTAVDNQTEGSVTINEKVTYNSVEYTVSAVNTRAFFGCQR